MTLENKIKQILKDELKPENIRIIIHMIEFLKFKESENIWSEINNSEHEYILEEETKRLEEIKLSGEFISQENLLKELGISQDKI